MKILGRCLGVIAVLAVGLAAYAAFNPHFVTRAQVAGQVWGLNLGIIKVEQADWGFLKLRSGRDGVIALSDLERHGCSDRVKAVAVAVQQQWLAKGHVFTDHLLFGPRVQGQETRFSELNIPRDGKVLRQDLSAGQVIPDSFWQTQRFRIGCASPPPSMGGTSACTLRVMDLNGDGHPEVVVDQRYVGLRDAYLRPAIEQGWEIYQQDGDAWYLSRKLRFCPVDQSASGDARPVLASHRTDMLWVSGHAANFYDSDCYTDNSTDDPVGEAQRAVAMAGKLKAIKVVTPGTVIQPSLAAALRAQAILQAGEGGPVRGGLFDGVRLKGLPPCFVAADPKACVAVVHDFNGDGSDDVAIIDGEVGHEAKAYRVATLLTFGDGAWTVASNHTVCVGPDEDLTHAVIEIKPATWLPIRFAGRTYIPGEVTDLCEDPFFVM